MGYLCTQVRVLVGCWDLAEGVGGNRLGFSLFLSSRSLLTLKLACNGSWEMYFPAMKQSRKASKSKLVTYSLVSISVQLFVFFQCRH